MTKWILIFSQTSLSNSLTSYYEYYRQFFDSSRGGRVDLTWDNVPNSKLGWRKYLQVLEDFPQNTLRDKDIKKVSQGVERDKEPKKKNFEGKKFEKKKKAGDLN